MLLLARDPAQMFEILVSSSNLMFVFDTPSLDLLVELIIGMEFALCLFLISGISSTVSSMVLWKEKLVNNGKMKRRGLSKNFAENFFSPKMLMLMTRT